ncbi:MAG: hypothetical protein L0241_09630 [Planctomycetia bacterium]|nr:hypothetical protein [Planctomycetia bacterium]
MAWLFGLLLPVALMGAGVIAKKLISPSAEFDWPDAYLGPEFTLATATICAINYVDLERLDRRAEVAKEEAAQRLKEIDEEIAKGANINSPAIVQQKTKWAEKNDVQDELLKEYRHEKSGTFLCLMFAGFSYLGIGLAHRNWELHTDVSPELHRKRLLYLVVVSDVVGMLGMFIYLLGVKGIH